MLCNTCGADKSPDEFHHRSKGARKRSGSCKACSKTRAVEYRAANLEKCRASSRRWASANKDRVAETGKRWVNSNWARHLANGSRSRQHRQSADPISYTLNMMLKRSRIRAKNNGWPFDLAATDLPRPLVCPVLGMVLDYSKKPGCGPLPNSPSLDRIVPALGYVKGNVRIISHKANTMKSDATPEQYAKIAADAEWVQRYVAFFL